MPKKKVLIDFGPSNDVYSIDRKTRIATKVKDPSRKAPLLKKFQDAQVARKKQAAKSAAEWRAIVRSKKRGGLEHGFKVEQPASSPKSRRPAAPLPPGLTTIKSGIVSKPPDAAVAAASAAAQSKLATMYAANKATEKAVARGVSAAAISEAKRLGKDIGRLKAGAYERQLKAEKVQLAAAYDHDAAKRQKAIAENEKWNNRRDVKKAANAEKRQTRNLGLDINVNAKTGNATIQGTVRDIDARIRSEYSERAAEEPEARHLNSGNLPPDRVKSALKEARAEGDDNVTVKIPSYSEFNMSLKEAEALDAHNDGLTDKEFASRQKRAALDAGAKGSRTTSKLNRSVAGPPGMTGEEVIRKAQERIASRTLGMHDETTMREYRKLDEQDRSLIKAQQGRMENTKFLADEKAASSDVAKMAAKANKKIASAASEQRRILATYGPDHPGAEGFKAKKVSPNDSDSSDLIKVAAARQKELSKVTTALKKAGGDPSKIKELEREWRQVAKHKKSLIRATMRGGGAKGVGGEQPRVPAGSERGGEWTDK